MSDMEVTVGLRRKTGFDFLNLSLPQILINEILYKILGLKLILFSKHLFCPHFILLKFIHYFNLPIIA